MSARLTAGGPATDAVRESLREAALLLGIVGASLVLLLLLSLVMPGQPGRPATPSRTPAAQQALLPGQVVAYGGHHQPAWRVAAQE